jgi:hypothetical protein
MSAKHTPGEWVIDWNVSRLDIFSSDGGVLVATLRRSALSPAIDNAAKANARLIAAAPELLEALQHLASMLKSAGYSTTHADAAIAKATGGQS